MPNPTSPHLHPAVSAITTYLNLQSAREDLVLRALDDGVSYGEIARAAGVKRSTVQGMARRARERKGEMVSAWGVEYE